MTLRWVWCGCCRLTAPEQTLAMSHGAGPLSIKSGDGENGATAQNYQGFGMSYFPHVRLYLLDRQPSALLQIENISNNEDVDCDDMKILLKPSWESAPHSLHLIVTQR